MIKKVFNFFFSRKENVQPSAGIEGTAELSTQPAQSALKIPSDIGGVSKFLDDIAKRTSDNSYCKLINEAIADSSDGRQRRFIIRGDYHFHNGQLVGVTETSRRSRLNSSKWIPEFTKDIPHSDYSRFLDDYTNVIAMNGYGLIQDLGVSYDLFISSAAESYIKHIVEKSKNKSNTDSEAILTFVINVTMPTVGEVKRVPVVKFIALLSIDDHSHNVSMTFNAQS